jgi:hypothetical protein
LHFGDGNSAQIDYYWPWELMGLAAEMPEGKASRILPGKQAGELE